MKVYTVLINGILYTERYSLEEAKKVAKEMSHAGEVTIEEDGQLLYKGGRGMSDVDIVKILRDYQKWINETIINIDDIDGDETFGAAADEIQSLRQRVEELESYIEEVVDHCKLGLIDTSSSPYIKTDGCKLIARSASEED